MTYGVYFFKGNGQVVPATRSTYAPVALGISNMTDACAVRDGFRALHPGHRWIAASEKFDNVQYGFRTATVDEVESAHTDPRMVSYHQWARARSTWTS